MSGKWPMKKEYRYVGTLGDSFTVKRNADRSFVGLREERFLLNKGGNTMIRPLIHMLCIKGLFLYFFTMIW